jgi:hypothetical protein
LIVLSIDSTRKENVYQVVEGFYSIFNQVKILAVNLGLISEETNAENEVVVVGVNDEGFIVEEGAVLFVLITTEG